MAAVSEELGGSPVGESGPAAVGVEIGQGGLTAESRGDVSEEDRSPFPASEEPWEQPGRLGLRLQQLP
jgi:hypothetical protein